MMIVDLRHGRTKSAWHSVPGKRRAIAVMNKQQSLSGARSRRRSSIPDQLAASLGRRIVAGEFSSTDTLPTEPAIQAEFDVSRTAVRESIRLLSAKGLVESRPRTGTRVRPPSNWNMLDSDVLDWHFDPVPSEGFVNELFEIRLVFETSAAAFAAEAIDERQAAELTEALHGMVVHRRCSEAHIDADLQFHRTLLDATGNRLFRSLVAMIESALGVLFMINWRARSMSADESIALHREVANMVLAGRSDGAAAAMRTLIENSRCDALKAVRSRNHARKA